MQRDNYGPAPFGEQLSAKWHKYQRPSSSVRPGQRGVLGSDLSFRRLPGLAG